MNVYLLVLVSGHCGEDGLGEAEGLDSFPAGHRLVGGQLAAEVLPDDVNARLVLVHGVEDDLVGHWGEKRWAEHGLCEPKRAPTGGRTHLCITLEML